MNVQIETASEGRSITLTLVGDLDFAVADTVRDALYDVEEDSPPVLVMDLRGISFFDSSGLHVVLAANARARADGRTFAVVRGSEAVDRVFRLTKADTGLRVLDDPSELS